MKFIYLGGFEMPDKNAAAQRVLAMAKIIQELGHHVQFYGITKNNDCQGEVDGIPYEAICYPQSTFSWVRYALGSGILNYLKSVRPDYVILYNYPAIAQKHIIGYCRNNGIKTIGDITEWYRKTTFLKDIDTWLRMKYVNRRLDGIIAISKYLSDTYGDCKNIIIPPLVDKSNPKWIEETDKYEDGKIHLVYIGSGSVKDRLDKVLAGIEQVNPGLFSIDIIGIDENRYAQIYPDSGADLSKIDVRFHGKLPHLEALSYLKKADFQIFFRDNIRVNNAGFPTKFVESMSAGTPVITNRISDIADYIQNGYNSYMIEDNSTEHINAVLDTISHLSSNDIEWLKSHCLVDEFDYHNYVSKFKDFLASI